MSGRRINGKPFPRLDRVVVEQRHLHAVRRTEGQLDVARMQVGNEVELFGEGFEQVGGGVAVVVVALSALRHADHQVLVEVAAQAIGRRGHAFRCCFLAQGRRWARFL
jgi:hypothetical protein